MSDDRYEIKFYPEICQKILKYLIDVLPDPDVSAIAFSMNKTLPEMVQEIEAELGLETDFSGDYIPSLQLDILFGIKGGDGKIKLCLVEVKRDKHLNLMHYSQLVGYLQVAKKIQTGLLWLVAQQHIVNPISNDFNKIISMRKLSASWDIICKCSSEAFSFKTGICAYTVNNGIDWVPLEECGGMSSWSLVVENMLGKKM